MATDNRQNVQQPSSAGGSGGIFGNASAAVGDVGVGTATSGLGDVFTSADKKFTFGAPVVNRTNNTGTIIMVVGLFGLAWLAKKRKVF